MRDARRFPRPVDESDGDVRPRGWLHHPLTRRVKAVATLLGALVAISGYLAGAGAKAIKWAGVATVGDVAAAATTAEQHRAADNKVAADQAAAVNAKLDALTAKVDKLSAAVLAAKRKPRQQPVEERRE